MSWSEALITRVAGGEKRKAGSGRQNRESALRGQNLTVVNPPRQEILPLVNNKIVALKQPYLRY
jgi:hypothetical protein